MVEQKENTDKNVLLLIVGPSASGKSTLCKNLCFWFDLHGIDYHNVVRDTTRPKRPEEKEKVDYNFISKDTLFKRVKNKSYYNVSCYNDWFYAFPKEELKGKICICACGKKEMDSLLKQDIDRDILIIRVKCFFLLRLYRYFNREREVIFEMFRRFLSDIKDYSCFYLNSKNNSNRLTINTSRDFSGLSYTKAIDFLYEKGILK